MSRRAAPASPSHRTERVGEAVRHALAEVLARGDVPDVELSRRPLTVTLVKMTPDLKTARVMIAPLGGKHAKETLEALAKNAKAIRTLVAKRINLKFAPELKFALDEGFGARAAIDDLLRSPAVMRDLTDREEGEEP